MAKLDGDELLKLSAPLFDLNLFEIVQKEVDICDLHFDLLVGFGDDDCDNLLSDIVSLNGDLFD